MSTPWPRALVGRLVAFLPALESGPFHEDAGGYRVLHSRLDPFYRDLYDSGVILPFDWSSWAHGDGASFVRGQGVATADLETVRRTITAHVRSDRFSEGHLLATIENGQMAALVRRLGELRSSSTWSYRIGTWNVERAPKSRYSRLRQEVEQGDADIWVLTETRDVLDLGPAYRSVASQDRGGGERWVTLWSRLPLIQEVTVRDEMRTAAALYEGPAGPILVYGTVLPWHTDHGPEGTARNWTEHYRVIPEQAAEWADLAARHPQATLCVAGDYNSDLADVHIYGTKQGRALLESGLAGAGLRCATRTAPGLADAPIDHVSVSGMGRISVVAAWEGTVDGEELSDHSAVVVEVSGATGTNSDAAPEPA